MCNPAAVVLIGTAVSGAMAYQGQKSAGKADQNYYNYLSASNDAQALRTEAVGEQQVDLIQDSASVESRNLARTIRRVSGTQRAVSAANGIDLSSVTSEDILRDTLNKAEMDEAALRFNADTKAWETMISAKQQARALRDQSDQFLYTGRIKRAASNINSVASILGSATDVAEKYGKWRRTSALTPGGAPASLGLSATPAPQYKIAKDGGYYA